MTSRTSNYRFVLKVVSVSLALTVANVSEAVEGMWLPEQMPQLRVQLKQQGLKLNPQQLTNLTGFPMNAVVSLGGCTASFVSKDGLIITNHHCIFGDLQYNSRGTNHLIKKGFLAKNRAQELPAAPGRRVLVTQSVKNISTFIHTQLPDSSRGRERQKRLENAEKSIIAKCETQPQYRCRVFSFYGGAKYYLFKQLELKDLRVVYAPAESIGKYGGDIDNWMWPRHTGDFSFYRAYVGPDGQPALFSPNNVPYHPKHFLPVSNKGVHNGDFVMVAGYPGRTQRHRLALEAKNQFAWYYPRVQKLLADMSATIIKTTAGRKDARVKYASTLAGINNYAKNFTGMMAGFAHSDLLQRKRAFERKFQNWVNQTPTRKARYGSALNDLEKLIKSRVAIRDRDFAFARIRHMSLLNTANQLYKWSRQQRLGDRSREPGFQNRDQERFKERLERFNRRYDRQVELALWGLSLRYYLALPATSRSAVIDRALNLKRHDTVATALPRIRALYRDTQLEKKSRRLQLFKSSPKVFQQTKDPLLRAAIILAPFWKKTDDRHETYAGNVQHARAHLMSAMIQFSQQQQIALYDDANGSLRITFGKIQGYTPTSAINTHSADGSVCDKDGCRFTAFTTVAGILAKNTGVAPFNAPKAELALIKARQFGRYRDPVLNSVPVDFLSDVDTTGGNSGSPTMNARGELVGLLFDGTYDSINADWDFNRNTRSIHLDIRYALWIMKYLDHANNLLAEISPH